MRAVFRLHHLTIDAHSDDAELRTILADILRYKGAEPVDGPEEGDLRTGPRASSRAELTGDFGPDPVEDSRAAKAESSQTDPADDSRAGPAGDSHTEPPGISHAAPAGDFRTAPADDFRIGPVDHPFLRLNLTFSKVRVLPPLPDGAEQVGAFGPDLDTYRKDRRFFLAGPDSRLDVHPERGSAAAYFDEDRLNAAAPDEAVQRIYYPLTFGLTVLLREHGLYGLHAGALERDGRGLVLAASSDSGKTTATLALVRQGWRYVSDDALLIRSHGGYVEALSFRRDFALDEEATEHFPELRDVAWPRSPSDPSKLRINLEAVRPGAFVPSCTPAALILPRLTGERVSRLVELDRLGAFEHLMAQSALTAAPLPDRIGAQMDMLAALLQQVTIYRLEAGRDVLEDPEAFSRRLDASLCRAREGQGRRDIDSWGK